jgi:hypothetical protein
MAIADGPATTGIQRGRGGFMRSSQDTPYVTDPSGAVVKSGDRKGQPKRLPYGSPSGAGKLIENSKALEKWGERRVVLGIGTDLALIADCAALAKLDVDSDEFKDAADQIVMRCKDAAEANLAADRGNAIHALTELPDWLGILQRGEAETALGVSLGLTVEVQRSIHESWTAMLERDGLEILATEASCVDDTWRLAGTLDHIARTTKPLTFVDDNGEMRAIPAGTVLVLDKKTGKMRVTPRSAQPLYWHGYVIQVASYAQSLPYDTEAETRGVWPWPIDQTHALIAHIDILGALDGDPSCELVYVDLVAGREHGGACVLQAKAWNSRTDLLSVNQVDAEGIAEIAPSVGPFPADVEPPEVGAASPASGIITEAVPPAASGEGAAAAPAAPSQPRALDWLDKPRELPVTPDEGDDLSGDEYASGWLALESRFKRLPDVVLEPSKRYVREARTAGVSFQRLQAQTARRFDIYRGLIGLAEADGVDDESMRALIAHAMGSDAPLFPTVTVGHALGSLDAAGARRFAEAVEAFIAGRFVASINEAEQFVLVGV